MADKKDEYTLELRVAGQQQVTEAMKQMKNEVRTAGDEADKFNAKQARTAAGNNAVAHSVTAWINQIDKLQREVYKTAAAMDSLKKGTDDYSAAKERNAASTAALSSAMNDLNAKGVIAITQNGIITGLINQNTGATARSAAATEILNKMREQSARSSQEVSAAITVQEQREIALAQVEERLTNATKLFADQLKMLGVAQADAAQKITVFEAAENAAQISAINYNRNLIAQSAALKGTAEAEELHKRELQAKAGIVQNQIEQTARIITLHAEQAAKAKGTAVSEQQLAQAELEVSTALSTYNTNMMRLKVSYEDRVRSIATLESMTYKEAKAEMDHVQVMANEAEAASKDAGALNQKAKASEEAAKAAKKDEEAVKAVMQAHNAAVRPTDELGQKFRILQSQGVSTQQILAKYRNEILTAAQTQRQFNEPLDKTVAAFVPMAQKMKDAEDKAAKMARMFETVKGTMLGFMAGMGGMRVMEVITNWIASLREFQEQWVRTRVLMDGTEESVKQVQQAFFQLDGELGSTRELLHGMQIALKSGFSNEQALTITKFGAMLAKVTGSSVTDGVELLRTTMKSFNLDMSEAEQTAAKLWTMLRRAGDLGPGSLTYGIAMLGPAAEGLGVKIEELGVLIAGMAQSGQSGTRAMMSLQMMMSNLADPTSRMNKMLEVWGVEAGKDVIQSKGFLAVMRDIANEMQNDTERAKELGFSGRQLGALMAALKQAEEQAGISTRNLHEDLKAMDKTLADQSTRLFNNLQREMLSFVEAFGKSTGIITHALELINDHLTTIIKTLVLLGATIALLKLEVWWGTLGGIAGVLGRVGTALGGFVAALFRTGAALTAVGTGATAASGGMALLARAVPILLYVALAAEVWNIIKGLVELKRTSDQTDAASKDLEATTARLAAKLKEKGIEIKRQANEDLLVYAKRVNDAAAAQNKLNAAQNEAFMRSTKPEDLEKRFKNVKPIKIDLPTSTEIDEWAQKGMEAYKKYGRAQDEVAVKIAWLKKAQADETTMMRVLGPEITKVAQEARSQGDALHPLIAAYYDAAESSNDFVDRQKKLQEELKKSRQDLVELGRVMQFTTNAMKQAQIQPGQIRAMAVPEVERRVREGEIKPSQRGSAMLEVYNAIKKQIVEIEPMIRKFWDTGMQQEQIAALRQVSAEWLVQTGQVKDAEEAYKDANAWVSKNKDTLASLSDVLGLTTQETYELAKAFERLGVKPPISEHQLAQMMADVDAAMSQFNKFPVTATEAMGKLVEAVIARMGTLEPKYEAQLTKIALGTNRVLAEKAMPEWIKYQEYVLKQTGQIAPQHMQMLLEIMAGTEQWRKDLIKPIWDKLFGEDIPNAFARLPEKLGGALKPALDQLATRVSKATADWELLPPDADAALDKYAKDLNKGIASKMLPEWVKYQQMVLETTGTIAPEHYQMLLEIMAGTEQWRKELIKPIWEKLFTQDIPGAFANLSKMTGPALKAMLDQFIRGVDEVINAWGRLTPENEKILTDMANSTNRAVAELLVPEWVKYVQQTIDQFGYIPQSFYDMLVKVMTTGEQWRKEMMKPLWDRVVADARTSTGKLDPELDKLNKKIQKGMEEAAGKTREEWMKQVSTIVTDWSKGIADMIFEGKSFAETMKGIFKEFGKMIVRTILETAFLPIKKILEQITGAIYDAATGKKGTGSGKVKTGPDIVTDEQKKAAADLQAAAQKMQADIKAAAEAEKVQAQQSKTDLEMASNQITSAAQASQAELTSAAQALIQAANALTAAATALKTTGAGTNVSQVLGKPVEGVSTKVTFPGIAGPSDTVNVEGGPVQVVPYMPAEIPKELVPTDIIKAAMGGEGGAGGGGGIMSGLGGILGSIKGGLGSIFSKEGLKGAFGKGGFASSMLGGIGFSMGSQLFMSGMSGHGAAGWGKAIGGGALAGAGIGTMILPGIGTAIGAIVGTIVAVVSKSIQTLVRAIVGKSVEMAGSMEVARDLGGIQVSEDYFKKLYEGYGLNKDTAWGIRKDITFAPKTLVEMGKLAQQQGKMEAFLKSLEKVETAWGTFNFRKAYELGDLVDDWEALDKAFIDAFEHSSELQKQMPNWKQALTMSGDAVKETAKGFWDMFKAWQKTGEYSEEMVQYLEDNAAALDEAAKKSELFADALNQARAAVAKFKELKPLLEGFAGLRDAISSATPPFMNIYELFLNTGTITDSLREQIQKYGGELAAFEQYSKIVQLNQEFASMVDYFRQTGEILPELRQKIADAGGDLAKLDEAAKLPELNNLVASIMDFGQGLMEILPEVSGLQDVLNGEWNEDTWQKLSDLGLDPTKFTKITDLIKMQREWEQSVSDFAGGKRLKKGDSLTQAISQFGGAEGQRALDLYFNKGQNVISADLLNKVKSGMDKAYKDERKVVLDYLSEVQKTTVSEIKRLSAGVENEIAKVGIDMIEAYNKARDAIVDELEKILKAIQGEVQAAGQAGATPVTTPTVPPDTGAGDSTDYPGDYGYGDEYGYGDGTYGPGYRGPKRQYQRGGYVDSTGPAIVHRGEYVVPAERVTALGGSDRVAQITGVSSIRGRASSGVAAVGLLGGRTGETIGSRSGAATGVIRDSVGRGRPGVQIIGSADKSHVWKASDKTVILYEGGAPDSTTVTTRGTARPSTSRRDSTGAVSVSSGGGDRRGVPTEDARSRTVNPRTPPPITTQPVLPVVASMDVGGMILKTGAAIVHAGEAIVRKDLTKELAKIDSWIGELAKLAIAGALPPSADTSAGTGRPITYPEKREGAPSIIVTSRPQPGSRTDRPGSGEGSVIATAKGEGVKIEVHYHMEGATILASDIEKLIAKTWADVAARGGFKDYNVKKVH